MTGLLLSQEERERFVKYLEHEAISANAIAGEMEKLGGSMMKAALQRERALEAACLLIATRLRSVHTDTITEGHPA